MTRRFTFPTWAVLLVALALAGAISAASFLSHGGWTKDGISAATRWTARFALPWFALAWCASALARLWPGGWRALILRRRRALGLGFAGAHGVHLIMLSTGYFVFGRESSPLSVIGGGATYILIAAMALSSNDASVRALGPARWKLLHTIGASAIAGVFAYSYANRVPDDPLLGLSALALLGAAASLRIAAWLKARLARRTVAA